VGRVSNVIPLPDELFEALAQRTAEIIEERGSASPDGRWLKGAAAIADYLGWPKKRVYNYVQSGELPIEKNGRCLVAHSGDLDRYLRRRLAA